MVYAPLFSRCKQLLQARLTSHVDIFIWGRPQLLARFRILNGPRTYILIACDFLTLFGFTHFIRSWKTESGNGWKKWGAGRELTRQPTSCGSELLIML
jgi:hypothetical protein